MADQRPAVAVGHLVLRVSDVPQSSKYFTELGMRAIEEQARIGILELRGGTHLVLLPAEEPVEAGAEAPFDLIVDDIESAHRDCDARGLAPSEIRHGKIHSAFTLTDPSGYALTINSTHVSGRPV